VTLSEDKRTVLAATAGRKASYGGVKDRRFHEAHRIRGITRERCNTAKASLIDCNLLNKAGAISGTETISHHAMTLASPLWVTDKPPTPTATRKEDSERICSVFQSGQTERATLQKVAERRGRYVVL
jgi:hypothetical protein